MRIVSVTFVSQRQKKNPQLTFPRKVARLLGIRSKQNVRIVIRKKSGEILLDDEVPLRSGTEIYGAAKVKPRLTGMQNAKLWIEAWRPKKKKSLRRHKNAASSD